MTVTIEQIDTTKKSQIRRFVRLPFRLYQDDSNWVPPIIVDQEAQLDKSKFPFYEHSDADFFVAVEDGRDVGRIAAIENRRFNQYHGTRKAQFYYFECENDLDAATALFGRVVEWAQRRGLDTIIGPKGLGPLDGYGILTDGFQHRQMMTMMNYNPPYYPKLLEVLGFSKEVDFVSCYASSKTFTFPEKVHLIADRVKERGSFKVINFHSVRDLKKWAGRIGEAYNQVFVHNWEYYPLTEKEIAYVVSNLEMIANPELIKIILYEEKVVGFLFAFPDIAPAIQRSRGRLLPFGLIDMLLEMRKSRWLAVNTAGVLPEYQGRGGNALLYSELENTIVKHHFEQAALYQVAETAVKMRSDLLNLGGTYYKNHRVYQRKI